MGLEQGEGWYPCGQHIFHPRQAPPRPWGRGAVGPELSSAFPLHGLTRVSSGREGHGLAKGQLAGGQCSPTPLGWPRCPGGAAQPRVERDGAAPAGRRGSDARRAGERLGLKATIFRRRLSPSPAAAPRPPPLVGHVHDEGSQVVRVPDPERQPPLLTVLGGRDGGGEGRGSRGSWPPAASTPALPCPARAGRTPVAPSPARGCRRRVRAWWWCPRGGRCAPACCTAAPAACRRRRPPRGSCRAPASAGRGCGDVPPGTLAPRPPPTHLTLHRSS